MKSLLQVLLIFFVVPSFGQGDNSIDSILSLINNADNLRDRVYHTQSLFYKMMNIDQDTALIIAKDALQKSQYIDDVEVIAESHLILSNAFFINDELDSMQNAILNAIPYYKKIGKHDYVAKSYKNLALVGERTQQPDSSLKYVNQCIDYLELYPDSLTLGEAYTTKGVALMRKGYYRLAADALLNSLKILEAVDEYNSLGYVCLNLGTTFFELNRYGESKKYNDRSIEYFGKVGNRRAQIQVTNNQAVLLSKFDQEATSKQLLLQNINDAFEWDIPWLAMEGMFNMMEQYYAEKQPDSTLYWADRLDSLSSILDYDYSLGASYRHRAMTYCDIGEISKAKFWELKARPYTKTYYDPQHTIYSYNQLASVKECLGDYKSSIELKRTSQILSDSVFSVISDRHVKELEVIYETEKKDAEIKYLNKEAELDATRKRALWGGILLLAISALSIIYSIIQRAKKKRLILEKEKQLEVQKRESTERELEYKQKELTAKVLQLASKNEFLQKLEVEVTDLTSSIDASVSKASQRISRMIGYESTDDQEWEQFGKEFSSIHSSFLNRLREQFGKFSKSEMRLISLLKMNLSSKEIANTLRISDDGVKKARYRLRKKMDLNSDIDIQQYLLNY